MNKFLRATVLLLLAGILSQCSTTNNSGPVPGAKPVSWPPQGYTSVRGYAYHCDAEGLSRDFMQPGGQLHKGVLQPAGVQLNADQIQRLQSAMTTPFTKSWRTPCYAPHHAFVFYNAQGKAVAHLEICFTCNKFIAHPSGLPEYIDMNTLWTIVRELGLPAGSGKDFYKNIYDQQKGR